MKAIRFKGGPANEHIAALASRPREFTFPILPPKHQPDRRLVAVYRLARNKGEAHYQYEGERDA